jgi:cell division protein YceG involved in septum cleavage
LYNKSDLVVVLVIVVIGGILIWQKTSTLMSVNANEPATYENIDEDKNSGDLNVGVSSSGISKGAIDNVANNEKPDAKTTTPAAATKPTAPATTTKPAEPANKPATKGGSFTVKSGWSSEQIASSLKSKGYIESKDAFLKVASKTNADTKLRSGKFTIPAGSTNEEIIKILTQ